MNKKDAEVPIQSPLQTNNVDDLLSLSVSSEEMGKLIQRTVTQDYPEHLTNHNPKRYSKMTPQEKTRFLRNTDEMKWFNLRSENEVEGFISTPKATKILTTITKFKTFTKPEIHQITEVNKTSVANIIKHLLEAKVVTRKGTVQPLNVKGGSKATIYGFNDATPDDVEEAQHRYYMITIDHDPIRDAQWIREAKAWEDYEEYQTEQEQLRQEQLADIEKNNLYKNGERLIIRCLDEGYSLEEILAMNGINEVEQKKIGYRIRLRENAKAKQYAEEKKAEVHRLRLLADEERKAENDRLTAEADSIIEKRLDGLDDDLWALYVGIGELLEHENSLVVKRVHDDACKHIQRMIEESPEYAEMFAQKEEQITA